MFTGSIWRVFFEESKRERKKESWSLQLLSIVAFLWIKLKSCLESFLNQELKKEQLKFAKMSVSGVSTHLSRSFSPKAESATRSLNAVEVNSGAAGFPASDCDTSPVENIKEEKMAT